MKIFKQVDEKLQSKLLFLVSIIFVFCAIFAITLSAKLVDADTQSTEGYNVYFDLRGGSISSGSVSQYVKYGEDATPPVVKADDEFYLFAGWVGDYQNVTSDRCVYATYDRYIMFVLSALIFRNFLHGKLPVNLIKKY